MKLKNNLKINKNINVFVLVHKHLRKSLEIINTSKNITYVNKIFILLTYESSSIYKYFQNFENNFTNKIIIYPHNRLGIEGAWMKAMEVAIEEKLNFLIFENDIVPSNFFFKFAKQCFKNYENENKFFGFTGYAPHENTSIKNKDFLNTYLSYFHGSWSFGTTVEIAKKFFLFLKKYSKNEIGNIIFKNISRVGRSPYISYQLDQKYPNKRLIQYKWTAFMISCDGFFVHPSEHLVNFYGSDEYAENCYDKGIPLLSESDYKYSKTTKIKFEDFRDSYLINNQIIINYVNPNKLQILLKKIKRKILNFLYFKLNIKKI